MKQGKGMTMNVKDLKTLNALFGNNVATSRTGLLNSLFDSRRDIDDECGYPKVISLQQYQQLYEREGIGTRIIRVFPEACWAGNPVVHETEDDNLTPFEEAWEKLEKKFNLYHYMSRIDELSGIGRFGILLLGIDDGQELSTPVESVVNYNSDEPASTGQSKLIYIRVMSESSVTVKSTETDTANPRYGQPTLYSVMFSSTDSSESMQTKDVHWTRVIHVADNREQSEVYGVPRLRSVYNRIYDLRKVLSGSGEMFWKGGFPGYAFTVDPELSDATIDTDALREEITSYANGLQRYMNLVGVTVQSLTPQVADPTGHVENQLKVIAIALGVPARVLMGSEQAQLASAQDKKTWQERVKKRQESYLSPMLVKPFIDRLIAMNILPPPAQFDVLWPDLASPSLQDKAEVAKAITEAISKYVAAGADVLIPPTEFMLHVLKLEPDIVEAIEKAMMEHVEDSATTEHTHSDGVEE